VKVTAAEGALGTRGRKILVYTSTPSSAEAKKSAKLVASKSMSLQNFKDRSNSSRREGSKQI